MARPYQTKGIKIMVGPSAVFSVPQQVPAKQALADSPADAGVAASATSSAPQGALASRPPVPIVTADVTGASARSFVAPGVAAPVPATAAPPANQIPGPSTPSPERAAAEAQKAAVKYLEGAVNPKVSSDNRAIYQVWASKTAEDNLKTQDAELRKANSTANVDLSDLKKNVEDARRLIALTKPNLSRQEILQGIAEIKTMQAEAELVKLANGTRQLSDDTLKLSRAEHQLSAAELQIAREIRPPAAESSPAKSERQKRIQNIASEATRAVREAATGVRNDVANVRAQQTQTRTAMDAAAKGWKHAEANAPEGSPEAAACAKGYSHVLGAGERVNAEVNDQDGRLVRLENDLKNLDEGLRQLQDILAKFASFLAPAAVKEAQIAFHEMQLRLLEEAKRIRRELGREADAEAVKSDRRKVTDAEREEAKRVEADVRDMQQKQRDLAELKTAAANEKFQQDRERRAAEVAKREGTTPRTYE
jgi:hypothetical protein